MGRVHLQAFHGMYDSGVVFLRVLWCSGYHSNRVWPFRDVAVVLEMVLDCVVQTGLKVLGSSLFPVPLSPDRKRQGVRSVSMCC